MSAECIEEGCNQPKRKRERCEAHYRRLLRAERVTNGETCTFGGCDKPLMAKGYCSGHYEQHRRGIPLRPLRVHRAGKASPMVDGKKRCTTCDDWLPITAFSRRSASPTGYHSICKRCDTLSKYGINRKEFAAMAADGCHVCHSRENLVVDHDHNCCPGERSCGECVTGVLCHGCNLALGFTYEDPARLRALARYAEERKTVIRPN